MTTTTNARPTPPTQAQLEDLMVWRAEALERMPYFARILYALRPLAAPGLGTFACDPGYRLYVDFEAVAPRGVQWCAEALLHECGHLFGEHASRAKEYAVAERERFLWNLAGDAEINDDLVAAGCTTIAENGVLPSHFDMPDHLLAERYMDQLRTSMPSAGAGGEGGAQQPGGADGEGGAQQPGTDQSGQFEGCGSASGGQAAPCELAADDDAGGAAPAAGKAEQQVTLVATAAAIREHAAKHPGTTPGGLVQRAETILAPSKIPWRQVLGSALRRAVAIRAGMYDTTYLRPSRHRNRVEVSPGRRAVYPGTYTPEPQIAVVRDTSGSMQVTELQMVTVEIEAIAAQTGVRGDQLRVLDVDTEVSHVRGYHGASSLDDVYGRGGTDMRAGIAAAIELRPRPTVIVVVTDGYTPWSEDKPKVPVVICIVGRGELQSLVEQAPEWATVVTVDPTEK